jgi:hypothetical protein
LIEQEAGWFPIRLLCRDMGGGFLARKGPAEIF